MPHADAFPDDLEVFGQFRASEEGRRWIESLPGLVAEYEARWKIRTGPPYRGGVAAWAAPAELADGTPAALKISWPHREARYEAAGLGVWDGDGAVRVYEADEDHYALLIERCSPGTRLDESGLSPEAALEIAAGIARRLWVPAPPSATFERVGDVMRDWAELTRERMARLQPRFDPGLVDIGIGLLDSLPATAARDVVIHGDFNPGNLLAAEREPWLAIDAKPMVGDPGYDPSPLVLQVDPPLEKPDATRAVRERFELFASLAGEPAGRLMAWSVARAVESALWEVSRDEHDSGTEWIDQAAIVARAAGL